MIGPRIAEIGGRYEGDGVWHDSIGNSMKYRIAQTNRVIDSGFQIAFRHDFADGSVVDAELVLTRIAAHIYTVRVSDDEVGHGYALGGTLCYHMRVGAAIVEVSYQLRGADELEVLGSSTTNAAGNYIAWREELRRIGA